MEYREGENGQEGFLGYGPQSAWSVCCISPALAPFTTRLALRSMRRVLSGVAQGAEAGDIRHGGWLLAVGGAPGEQRRRDVVPLDCLYTLHTSYN